VGTITFWACLAEAVTEHPPSATTVVHHFRGRKQAAIDLFNEESEDEQDRKAFQESIEQITKDTPQAQVASKRLSRLLTKVGKGTASAIRDILVDVASGAAKKILLH
jgi:hypothetical protein